MRKKGVLVKDLEPGKEVEGLFVIFELRSSPEPRGENPYILFSAGDSTGSVWAKIWPGERYREIFTLINEAQENEKVVFLKGRVEKFGKSLELRVREIELLEEGEFEDFTAVPSLPPERIEELFKALNSLVYGSLGSDPDSQFAKRILTSFLGDWLFVSQFKRAPAARFYHHARVGGLLEHTYGVLKLALEAVKFFNEAYPPGASVPLVVAGAVLHDIGKVRAYRVGRQSIQETREGQLLGHIVLGLQMIQERAKEEGLADDPRLTALLHVVASHHGYEEFGSPVSPLFPEAFIVHFADDLDAKLAHIAHQEPLPSYSQMLRRVLYPPFGWEEE